MCTVVIFRNMSLYINKNYIAGSEIRMQQIKVLPLDFSVSLDALLMKCGYVVWLLRKYR